MSQRDFSNKRRPGSNIAEYSTVSDGGMFKSRPFVVQSKVGEDSKKSDLRTSLMRAQRYGHNLSRIDSTKESVSTVKKGKQANPSSNTQAIQMMYRGGGRGRGRGRKRQNQPYPPLTQKDQYGRQIDRYGRVKEDGKTVKHYVIPYLNENEIVLPIKDLISPHPHNKGEKQFMGGMPSLVGGNMEAKHRSPFNTVSDELNQELKNKYKIGRWDLENVQSVEDEKAKYNIHTGPVEEEKNPKPIPTIDEEPAYYEMSGEVRINPLEMKGKSVEEIKIEILKKADINPADPNMKNEIDDYMKAHTTNALAQHIFNKNNPAPLN